MAVLQAASGGCQAQVFPGNVLFGDISLAHPVIEPIVQLLSASAVLEKQPRGVGFVGSTELNVVQAWTTVPLTALVCRPAFLQQVE